MIGRRAKRAGIAVMAVAALAGCTHHRKKPAKSTLAPARMTMIGVNSYLWQASLATVKFMPLATVDSNGGAIVTDWYVNPQSPNERIKLTVTILDAELRADAVRVTANRQELTQGGWVEAQVRAGTVQKFEELILIRARDLRRAAIGG